MQAIVKSDVFFFITTVAVIIVTVLLAMVLVRFFQVLGNVKSISEKANEEVENIKGDFQKVRNHVQDHGLRLVDIINFFKGFTKSKTAKEKKSDK